VKNDLPRRHSDHDEGLYRLESLSAFLVVIFVSLWKTILRMGAQKKAERAGLVLPHDWALTGDQGLGGTSRLYATVVADIGPSVAPPKIVAKGRMPSPEMSRFPIAPTTKAVAKLTESNTVFHCMPIGTNIVRFAIRRALRHS
jgi:hypothetical protein